MKRATSRRASALVAKCLVRNSSHCSVENQLSAAASSKHDPARPIDWLIPNVAQARSNTVAVYSPGATVGVEDGAGDVTAAHGDGHHQRGGGEPGVVMLRQCEPDDPLGGQILDRGEVELGFVGGYLGQISAPLDVDRRRREVTFDQVRSRWGSLVGPGQPATATPRRPCHETLAGHRRLDTLLRHPPTCLEQVGEHSR
jgi:hypothetical protein